MITSERFDCLPFVSLPFVSFLESEIKVVRCLQPSTTELSISIRKNGLPSYKLIDDFLDPIEDPIKDPINIYKNPLGLVIPKMYDIVIAEIEWSRKLIKEGKNPTVVVNENPHFILWIQNSHYLIVDALVDFFKDYIDLGYDNLFITTVFAYGAAPLTTLFFTQYSSSLPELMFLHECIYENENDHMVDYMIGQASQTGQWSKIFVNKHPRVTQIMIDFWSHPLDAFAFENISVDIARFKLANYLCTRPDPDAIVLVKNMEFDEILDICSNPHKDAVSYALENVKKENMTAPLFQHMMTQAIQNSHPDMVDYVLENVDKFESIFQTRKASSNTNPKMVSFLMKHPSFIDITLLLKNPAIIEREMK
jgi:hypothetical protein